MPPLPRGTCPVCGGEVALRRDGATREHRDRRVDRFAHRPPPTCPGSGELSVEQTTRLGVHDEATERADYPGAGGGRP